ncbi:MAG TPA: TIGR03621 family F420-dependent LLM class oxidoreductase [Acidimicrobiales bacterium]|nr:TIGR03621 family F420-dependent LLM class oxidoreductase [Acidimicrobiales bacterium]
MTVRPFRFSVTPPPIQSVQTWRNELSHIADVGFDAIVIPDHWTDGWSMEPLVGLSAAALCNSSLRLQTGVLGNDYRHPVQVHRSAALLDVLSEGRLILGLGAGWLVSDYETAGISLDAPGVRVSRLEEAIAVLKGLFRPDPFDFEGKHYCIRGLEGRPEPVQKPHPPLFIGGGSQRVLSMAGREADIVGINASLKAGVLGRHAVVDLLPERVKEKVGWVAAGAASVGRSIDDIELEMNHWLVRVTAADAEANAYLEKIAARYTIDPDVLARSPSVLVGTIEACVDTLVERRDTLGISYFQLDAGYPPKDLDELAPILEALSGL